MRVWVSYITRAMYAMFYAMYFERLRTWHRIVLQPITHLHVHICSSHVYLLSDNALSLRRLNGLWKWFIPRSNEILKWQHTGAMFAIWTPFVIQKRSTLVSRYQRYCFAWILIERIEMLISLPMSEWLKKIFYGNMEAKQIFASWNALWISTRNQCYTDLDFISNRESLIFVRRGLNHDKIQVQIVNTCQ